MPKLFIFLFVALQITPVFANQTAIKGLDTLKIDYSAKKRSFIPRITEKDDAYMGPLHSTDTYVLDVKFTHLTEAQFTLLANVFGNTSLKYQAGINYRLEQFLPAFMQATLNHQFKTMAEKYQWPDFNKAGGDPEYEGSVELEDLRNYADSDAPLSTYINCWTTVYEFLRTWTTGSDIIDVTWLSRSSATTDLMETYTTEVKNKEILHFGDVLIFSAYDEGPGTDLVQHAAIYVMPGLYFEKTDTMDDYAIRFVLEDDLRAKYKELLAPGYKTGHYRVKKDAKIPRLAETRNLYSYDKDFYGLWFSESDLKTISLEFDWSPTLGGTSKPDFFPFRLHSIKMVKNGSNYVLDPLSDINQQFTSPDLTAK